jgi:hypothetical protein
MDRVSQEFGEVEVRDAAGRLHRLRDAWSDRTCVVLFVRQFG